MASLRWCRPWVACLAFAVGCSDEAEDPEGSDGGGLVSLDAGGPSGPGGDLGDAGAGDGGLGEQPDAGLDAGLQVGVDAGLDAGLQVSVDAGVRPRRPLTDGGYSKQTTSYAAGGGHAIDLYVPSGPGPFPVIVYVHGGAWLEGDRGQAAPLAQREAARGFVVASIDYRLSQVAKWPAQLHDVKAAVRWLRGHADQLRLDPARFATWGESAGAHLAAMLGASGGVAALEDLGQGYASESSRVQAVIDWYGPTDFLQMDAQTVAGCQDANHDGANSPESRLVGCAIQSCPQVVATASPQTYLDALDPPFLLMHGTKDCTVPTGQSRILDVALKAQGLDSTLVEVPNLGHDFDGLRSSPARMSQIEAFLDRVLYP